MRKPARWFLSGSPCSTGRMVYSVNGIVSSIEKKRVTIQNEERETPIRAEEGVCVGCGTLTIKRGKRARRHLAQSPGR